MDNAKLLRLEALLGEFSELIKCENIEECKPRRDEIEGEFAAILGELKPESAEETKQLQSLERQLSRVRKQFGAALYQLYQARDLERWEHYALKLKICEELEQLNELNDADLARAAKRVNFLRTRWQELGSVPHEKSDEIWHIFRNDIEQLQTRLNHYFAEQNVIRNGIDTAKKEIIEDAKKLAQEPNFAAATPKFKELQARWKALGAGHIKLDRALYAEFREICDGFFNARKAFFDERRHTLGDAVHRKKELIAAAEAIDVEKQNLKRESQELYAKWRDCPYAGREDQELYNKFKAALDAKFQTRQAGDSAKVESKLAWCADAAAFAAELESGAVEPAAGKEEFSRLRRRLGEIGETYGDAGRKAEHKVTTELRKIDAIFAQLNAQNTMKAASGRQAAESALAAALAQEETGDVSELIAAFAAAGSAEQAAELTRLAARPLAERTKKLADFSSRRRFLIGNWEHKLGLKSSLDSNVELLALALEAAIRDNFAGQGEKLHGTEAVERFLSEFFAVPLAAAEDEAELYDSFNAIIAKLSK